MGPLIVLDKSIFEALSKDELEFLYKHYTVVIPPILIMEIVGDLKKRDQGDDESRKWAAILAQKLKSQDSCMNAYYKDICILSLLGRDVPMDGTAIVNEGKVIETANREKGILIDRTPEQKVISDWQKGNFSVAEQTMARIWRSYTERLNFEEYKVQRNRLCSERFETVESLVEAMDLQLDDPQYQLIHIYRFMITIGLPEKYRWEVRKRWIASRSHSPLFKIFAPYAFYCYRAGTLFTNGLLNNLMSSRGTNKIDLEYLFYLPFCMAFTSDDKFHLEIIRYLLRDDHTFVLGKELKSDLKFLKSEWVKLTDQEKKDRAYNYGNYPPESDSSVTHKLWKKHMKPRTSGSGNLLLEMSEEEINDLTRKMNPIMDALRDATR